MPEDKQEEKTVDIDTSGPGADIELPEEKVSEVVETTETVEPEKQVEEKVEEKPVEEKQETKTEEKPVEEKQETKTEEKTDELKDYGEELK